MPQLPLLPPTSSLSSQYDTSRTLKPVAIITLHDASPPSYASCARVIPVQHSSDPTYYFLLVVFGVADVLQLPLLLPTSSLSAHYDTSRTLKPVDIILMPLLLLDTIRVLAVFPVSTDLSAPPRFFLIVFGV